MYVTKAQIWQILQHGVTQYNPHTCLWLVTNSSITHLDWVAFLRPRTAVPLVFLHGCSLLPIGRLYFHPQFGLATISVCLITASFQQLHNASSDRKLPFRAARCHAMYPYLSLARNNFSLIHLDWVAFLQPRPRVSECFYMVVLCCHLEGSISIPSLG